MRSFRVCDHLHEMIKLECKRQNTNFSSFIRNAALGVLRNRTSHRRDTEVTSAKSNELPFEWRQE
jgi:hypothetical protein